MSQIIQADAIYTNPFGDVVPVICGSAILINGSTTGEDQLAAVFEEDFDNAFGIDRLSPEQVETFERLTQRKESEESRLAERIEGERQAKEAAKRAEAERAERKSARVAAYMNSPQWERDVLRFLRRMR